MVIVEEVILDETIARTRKEVSDDAKIEMIGSMLEGAINQFMKIFSEAAFLKIEKKK